MSKLIGKRARLESEMKEATRKASEIMVAAEKAEQELSAEDRAKVQAHLDEGKTLKAQIDRLDGDAEMRKTIEALQVKDDQAAVAPGAGEKRKAMTLGQAFIESKIYDAIKEGKHRFKGFNASDEFDLAMGATNLTEAGGSGGPLVLPDYQQGILPLLFRQILVTDLIAPGTTNSNSVEYMQETTFTNAAAPRAEGGAAAQSTLVFNRINELVRSIDHELPITQEMAEDQAQAMSYVDGRLRLGVTLAEEDQLLNGDGTGVNLVGFLHRANLAGAQARGTDTNADAIFKQVMNILTTAFVMPDGIVINPTNWTTMVLSKDGNSRYYGPGPFQAAQVPVIWGIPGSVTPVIAANTSLVGCFRSCAQRFVRRGVTVSASNSHSDYFTKRLISLLAGLREALAVYRPGAFGTVTGLN
jgi:HK97 family phage major capsid protein